MTISIARRVQIAIAAAALYCVAVFSAVLIYNSTVYTEVDSAHIVHSDTSIDSLTR